MYRGLIHFHSIYSYDSILNIKKIVDFALENKLNFLILTDHDTIDGSVALKQYINKNRIDIEVLIASEYNTEFGDIIALGIKKEIVNMKFDDFIYEVKKQNGLLLFPHPYKGHKNIDLIIEQVDMVEVFNSRTDDKSNIKALKLANKYNKPIYYATDSHNFKSLKNAIIEFKKDENFIQSLLKSEIVIHSKKKSLVWEVYISQYIKAFKKKRIKLFISLTKSLIKSILTLKIFRKI